MIFPAHCQKFYGNINSVKGIGVSSTFEISQLYIPVNFSS
jgi:hypothetical protein